MRFLVPDPAQFEHKEEAQETPNWAQGGSTKNNNFSTRRKHKKYQINNIYAYVYMTQCPWAPSPRYGEGSI